jgi:hypothetical protein
MLLLSCLGAKAATVHNSPVVTKLNRMPLAFTQNSGQWNGQALFRANAGGFTAWFAKDGVSYQFVRRIGRNDLSNSRLDPETRLCGNDLEKDSVVHEVLTATFVGASPDPQVIGQGSLDYKCNYFIGNEPPKWRTDVPNFSAVVYKDIYPGIDLKYYGNGDGKIEYDFIIQPGADPRQIAIRYEGADDVCVDELGQLVVVTKWGRITERAPLVWQVVDGDIQEVGAKYTLSDDRTFGFKLDIGYEPEFAVVVDPVLSYSTYLNGDGQDFGSGIGLDSTGAVYVGGNTNSTDFPVQNPFQGTKQTMDDAFVTKLNPAGNGLVYSTYIGGNGDDYTYGLAVDQGGHAYIVGQTRSFNFPTQNSYQESNHGIANVFITKLSTGGNSLSYSTYLGGAYVDEGRGVAVDKNGNAYVTGWTRSTNFPLKNPVQPVGTGESAFITKLGAAGDSLVYSSRLNGNNWADAFGIAIDKHGNAYITGETPATNYPTVNAFQGSNGGGLWDGFVTKINSSGSALVFSTYLGGNDQDCGYGIAVDTNCNVYITGETASTNFPKQNAIYSTYQSGIFDAFVTKLDSAGNTLHYSTFLGGSDRDIGWAIAVDVDGSTYVTGLTNSANFPVLNPYQSTNQGLFSSDVFVAKLTPGGTQLVYSTYLGGSKNDIARGIAVDGVGHAYVTGETDSPNFPMKNGFQDTLVEGFDVFVTKLRDAKCGDADGSESIDISDAVFLINYIFNDGAAPDPLLAGDADCSGSIDISDVVYLINYIFNDGPAPCAGCK